MIEQFHFVKGLDAVSDAFAGTVYSDLVDVSQFGSLYFLVHKGAGATGVSTITVQAADDNSPSNVAAIPFRYRVCTSGDTWGAVTSATAAGFNTTAGASQLYLVEVDPVEIAKQGYRYARLKCVEVVNDPVLGGIVILGTQPRYASVLGSQID